MSNEGTPSRSAVGGPGDVDDSALLVDVARAAVARADGADWRVEPGEFWCRVTPAVDRMVGQGWKLHVSATLLSAPVVLARAADVLLRERCPFKFARGLTELGELSSRNCARGSGGKFITAYPGDDDQFRRLAAELDRVTDGLPGPPILSDRQVRPGSLVYYRYGVFGAPMELSNDGSFESVLVGPDGQRSRDRRLAWFSPPPWAKSPFADVEPAGTAADSAPTDKSSITVLVGGRFLVRGAIKHSYRGGVFRAVDQQSGADVVLKQARPHVMSDLTGADGRDVLRREADVLDQLSALGIAPAKVAVVEHEANLFLAEEMLPGITLRDWVGGHCVTSWRGEGAPVAEALALARQMVEIVTSVHERGMVVRDFTPNNILVAPDSRLRLIDVELAAAAGDRVVRSYTPSYAGPEVVSSLRYGPAPSLESDLFSLGATIFFMASGLDPLLPPDDESTDRSNQSRLAALIGRASRDMPSVRRLSRMIIGLMHDDPRVRWSTADALAFLSEDDGNPPAESGSAGQLADAKVDRLIVDGLTHVLRSMQVEEPRLFKASDFGRTTDPCTVQHGAAGVLGVLTRAAKALDDADVLKGVAAVADWMSGRLFDIPRILPGLYFGRSGVAWALYDAALLLGDDKMAGQAIELAKMVPVQWPNPDICHGAAGAGMAQWHFWTATGDPEFKQRGIQAADCVLQAAQERDGKWLWPIPKDFDSELAGLVHYGFAHGVAGAGAFLLYSWLVTGRDEYLTAARRAGDTLQAVADVEDGSAWWPSGEDRQSGKSRMRHWCSGSSGVGTFLARLWKVTNEQRFRDLAEAGAAAIRRDKWYSGPSACHGLAGDGEYLLDLADLTGAPHYRDWAQELAELIYVRHAIRDGLMVLPDESGAEVYPGFNSAMSGTVGFLLRLRTGGPRWWMPDDLLANKVPGAGPVQP